MEKAQYIGLSAAAATLLLVGYGFGFERGKSVAVNATEVTRCVNERYSGLNRLNEASQDFLVYLAVTREDKPVDLTNKKDLERYKDALRANEGVLVQLRNTCKRLVDAGVTEFAEDGGPLKPEMKKVLEERWRKLLRKEAAVIEGNGKDNG